MKKNDLINKWTKGIPYEVAFWNNVYRWKKTFNGLMAWANYGKTICLDNFDANTFLISCNNPKVLDVGCGMSYAPGNYINKNGNNILIDIHYIDPLAHYFNRILKRYKRNMPQIEFGMMEYLTSFYKENTIDLVIIQNALDHSAIPIKGIMEALAILKIGGVLYLNHHPKEAEKENYKGFHQYNITNENSRLIIYNKTERYDINEIIHGFASIDVKLYNNNITTVIKKTSEIPTKILSKEKKDRKKLYNEIMGIEEFQLNITNQIIRNCMYYIYNIIQFFAQALSWETKIKIKKIIGQA